MMASVPDTLAALRGPEVYWGAEGPMRGFRESDIKGFDSFDKFLSLIERNGLLAIPLIYPP